VNEQDYQRRLRRYRYQCDAERSDCEHRRAIVSCLVTTIAVLICCCMMVRSSQASTIAPSSYSDDCSALMRWPVSNARITERFTAPEKAWLAGHRGVDLNVEKGEELLAPADGVIAFVGSVAGKSVVTIRHGTMHGELTSTFEPATTDLSVGTTVESGHVFAHVEGSSDHCADVCLHWGLKGAGRDYVDPEGKVRLTAIMLKPVG
jgi:murein DD-endopeptidase MepM/ murein hydrolase activator NlpD